MPGAIAALYAGTVVYRSAAFRQQDLGLAGVRRYLNEQLPAEENMVPTDWRTWRIDLRQNAGGSPREG